MSLITGTILFLVKIEVNLNKNNVCIYKYYLPVIVLYAGLKQVRTPLKLVRTPLNNLLRGF